MTCGLLQLIYLPPPWGDCKVTAMDSDFFDSYSITACRIDCETRYLVDNCNCRMVHMPGRKSLLPCVVSELHQWCCGEKWLYALQRLMRVRVSYAQGDAPYCTPELYKECADPALGKKKALYTSGLNQRTLTHNLMTVLGQSHRDLFKRSSWTLAFSSLDFLVERDNNFCVCETPCNMTRYSKELSFVKIPSKASAKYLAKKYNKSEQYIK